MTPENVFDTLDVTSFAAEIRPGEKDDIGPGSQIGYWLTGAHRTWTVIVSSDNDPLVSLIILEVLRLCGLLLQPCSISSSRRNSRGRYSRCSQKVDSATFPLYSCQGVDTVLAQNTHQIEISTDLARQWLSRDPNSRRR